MRVIRRLLLSMIAVVAMAGLSRPAVAQSDSDCSSGALAIDYVNRTCFYIASNARTVQLGNYLPMQGKTQKRPANTNQSFQDTEMYSKLYDGPGNPLINSVHTFGWTSFSYSFTEASQIGNHDLYLDPQFGDNSPTITVTVTKYTPLYNISASSAVATLGQTQPVTISHSSQVFRANGQIAYFVRVPGSGTRQEYAPRRSVTGNSMLIFNDGWNITFSPANTSFNVAGPYAFSVAYVGTNTPGSNTYTDAYNTVPWYSNEVVVKIGPYPTTTSLTQSVATSMQGKPVTLTATVAPNYSPPISAPSGNVEFYDGTTLLGTATLASGTATLANTTSLRAVGSRSLTARYVGDVNNAPSTSNALGHTTQLDPALLVPIIDLVTN